MTNLIEIPAFPYRLRASLKLLLIAVSYSNHLQGAPFTLYSLCMEFPSLSPITRLRRCVAEDSRLINYRLDSGGYAQQSVLRINLRLYISLFLQCLCIHDFHKFPQHYELDEDDIIIIILQRRKLVQRG